MHGTTVKITYPLFLSPLYLTFELSKLDPFKLYSCHSKSFG